MDKKKVGALLGVIPLLTVITSVILFFVLRGPDANIYSLVFIYHVLAFTGILFAIFSNLLTQRYIVLIVGVIGNGLVLIAAYYLLFAIGMSEA